MSRSDSRTLAALARLALAAPAFVLFAPHAAFGQSALGGWTQPPTDPTFLPAPGEVVLNADFSRGVVDATDTSPDGAGISKSRVTSNLLLAEVAYGVTPHIAVTADLAYDIDGDEQFQAAGGPEIHHREQGFTDPRFGVIWRVFGPIDHYVGLDLAARYAPNAFSATSATATQAANDALGGQEVTLEAAVGRAERNFSIRGVFDAVWMGHTQTEDPASGADTRVSSAWAPSVALQSQLRFTPRASVNLDAGYNFSPTRRVIDDAPGGQSYIDHAGAYQTLEAALNYRIIPGVLSGSLDYIHTFYDHSLVEYTAPVAPNVLIGRSGNTLGARLYYTFR